MEATPAGEVQIVTLGERQDFELFLQIMGNRCIPTEIPATQGASILDGVINWPKIREHETEYLASGGDPGQLLDEFKRLAMKSHLLIQSAGDVVRIGWKYKSIQELENAIRN